MKRTLLVLMVMSMLSLSLVLSGCSGNNTENNQAQNTTQTSSNQTDKDNDKSETLKLAYVNWDSAVAVTTVAKAVLQEKLDCDVEMVEVKAKEMWNGVADKKYDAMLCAWLPSLHDTYYSKVKDKVDDLGPYLEGTKVGLVVPEYVTIDSIKELNNHKDKFNGKITGIDPQAGVMLKTEKAIEEYNLDFELAEGSGTSMANALEKAVENKEWIAVTGWTPHWKFAKWDLKYLKDPKGIYGEAENINVITRKGLKEDMPKVYKVLDNISITPEQSAQFMIWLQSSDTKPYEKAKNWINSHSDLVNNWIK